MKKPDKHWYKQIWDLRIKEMSWTEKTASQVAFLVDFLGLSGGERILDLACGYGRHALEFARRGYEVVGVDITEAYIEDAKATAKRERLNTVFVCEDVRNVSSLAEFDVVLNLADGAIGYLESDEENLKIFDVIARALKPGGIHFMDICAADYAETEFPKRTWDIGEKSISLADFVWDSGTKRMLYGGLTLGFGEEVPAISEVVYHSDTRLYSTNEVTQILAQRDLHVISMVTDYSATPYSHDKMQLQVYSKKN